MQYQDQPASGSTTLFPTRHNKLLVRWLCIGALFVRCGLALSPVSFRCLNVCHLNAIQSQDQYICIFEHSRCVCICVCCACTRACVYLCVLRMYTCVCVYLCVGACTHACIRFKVRAFIT